MYGPRSAAAASQNSGKVPTSEQRAGAADVVARIGSAYSVADFSDKLTYRLMKSKNRGAAAMQQVTDWLEKLDLGQYARRFAENDIDASVLPHLTDQSLKELGVSLGHRLKILAAIKELSPPTPTTPQPAAPMEAKPQDAAERRQVTVMFSDLVGSTALSARMDPEDLREVISAYQKCVAETVQRFGGFVAKYMGDGVLVYFGYPQAHEDDAERAVRAGLALIAAVGALKQHRAAANPRRHRTGLVVVGDLIGSGEAQERGVVGETPNLAARLQAVASRTPSSSPKPPESLLGSLFEYRDLGGIEAKGFAESGAGIRGGAPEHGGEPLRGAAHGDHAAGRPRRGD